MTFIHKYILKDSIDNVYLVTLNSIQYVKKRTLENIYSIKWM